MPSRKFASLLLAKLFKDKQKLWLIFSLIFSIAYSLLAVNKAFKADYLIQDDARQYLFWMQRFSNPNLFPEDLIADYFQSVTPPGYKLFYWGMSQVGISPFLLHKILPLFLGILITVYAFKIAQLLLPIPFTGFISTLLLNQSLWFQDDLASATPRAFVYPFFLAFLYYLLKPSFWLCLGAIALLGLFYPQYVLLCSGILILRLFAQCKKQQNAKLCLAGLTVAFLVLLPYALATSEFAPVITASLAQRLPEFATEGRSQFWYDNPLFFWLFGERSGLIPPLLPPLIWLGIFLPLLLKKENQFPLVKRVRNTEILTQILLAGLFWWGAAHLFLFKLHLPSRYTDHSGRCAIALAAGIVFTLLFERLLQSLKTPTRGLGRRIFPLSLSLFLVTGLLFYPAISDRFPLTNYRPGGTPELYEFFRAQPPDILIASLASEAHNLPSFSRRSILIGREYAIPYHWGYYRQFRQRVLDTIRAQYSPDQQTVKTFIQTYGIDFWLLEDSAFDPKKLAKDEWIWQYQPAAQVALQQLQQGSVPVLSKLKKHCAAFEGYGLVVVSADCLLGRLNPKTGELADRRAGFGQGESTMALVDQAT